MGDPLATIDPLVEFNRVLGRASHNLVLSMLIDSVAEIVADVLRVYRLTSEIELVAPRRAVVAALRARDAAEAARILTAHYAQTTRYVLSRVNSAAKPDA
jgi:DNA-binding GntR family transcriptional regulator